MTDLRELAAGLAALAFVCGIAAPSLAARLEVGPSRELKAPSEAAKVVQDGDTVVIDPGTYYNCAAWSASHLTIAGAGGEVVITDTTCQGKGIFVITGNDVTVRNLTFARARVADGNGAGIRFEGSNLTVEDCRFIDNQSGILTADNPDSAITISRSQFVDNGSCDKGCVSTLLVGSATILRVTGSRFSQTKAAHHIGTAARQNELVDNTIEDGPDGTSSYLVDVPLGGTLLLDGNRLEKGPHSSNRRAAVMVGDGPDLGVAAEIIATGNRFANDTGDTAAFIANWSTATPVLANNQFTGRVTPVSSSGAWVHMARIAAGQAKNALRGLAVAVYHAIR